MEIFWPLCKSQATISGFLVQQSFAVDTIWSQSSHSSDHEGETWNWVLVRADNQPIGSTTQLSVMAFHEIFMNYLVFTVSQVPSKGEQGADDTAYYIHGDALVSFSGSTHVIRLYALHAQCHQTLPIPSSVSIIHIARFSSAMLIHAYCLISVAYPFLIFYTM